MYCIVCFVCLSEYQAEPCTGGNLLLLVESGILFAGLPARRVACASSIFFHDFHIAVVVVRKALCRVKWLENRALCVCMLHLMSCIVVEMLQMREEGASFAQIAACFHEIFVSMKKATRGTSGVVRHPHQTQHQGDRERY